MNHRQRNNRISNQYLEIIRIFFANTSIRGFSRIVKSESNFLRVLWILFVSSTITFLVVSIFKAVIDYKQYSVNIQTYVQIDNATPFPALTFCNHQQFSEKAYQLWEESKVMSPTQFNELFRSAALKQFKEMVKSNMSVAEPDFNNPLFLTTMNDRISIYYQNLPSQISSELGHNISMIKNCIWSYGQNMAFDNHCEDEMLIVKQFSSPSYFNCFTVEPNPLYASVISKLGLIIWLGPDEETNIKHRQGFLLDIFEQAYGLRVVIHEPGSYPKIESQGLQIEPGRLNELSYQPEINVKVDTDRKPCISNPKINYNDLKNEFTYDIDLCFNSELQKILIKKCKCIYGYYPRIFKPNKQLPYCGYLDPEKYSDFLKRSKCISQLFNEAANIKSHLKESKKCIHRCTSIEFATTTSVTKWRPSDWQLYWLKEILDSWRKFYDLTVKLQTNHTQPLMDNDKRLHSVLTSRIEKFFKRKNLSEFIPDNEKLTFNERYTFVVVKRKANNTFIKEERLVLSFNALVSRIGGLCSLYIGLTFAFFIELIDFLYTIIFLRNKFQPIQTKITEKDSSSNQEKILPKCFVRNERLNAEKSLSEININPIDVEKNNLFQGTIYWNLYSKHNSKENKKLHEEYLRKSQSFLNLSNPWILLDQTAK